MISIICQWFVKKKRKKKICKLTIKVSDSWYLLWLQDAIFDSIIWPVTCQRIHAVCNPLWKITSWCIWSNIWIHQCSFPKIMRKENSLLFVTPCMLFIQRLFIILWTLPYFLHTFDVSLVNCWELFELTDCNKAEYSYIEWHLSEK